jgi:hypothetical protein
MKRVAAALAGLGMLVWGVAAWAGDCNEPGLDQEDTFAHGGIDYEVAYRTDAASTHRVTLANVADVRAALTDSHDTYVGMGFRSPYLNTLPTFRVLLKDDWWYAEPGCVVLHSPAIRTGSEEETRVITFHEIFHTVQRAYRCDVANCDRGYMGTTYGKWTSEGGNDAMMDKGFADLDDRTGSPFYEGSARNYVNAPHQTLFDREYDACLFWNYAMEQLGNDAAEPGIGVDFTRLFYERFAALGKDDGSASSRAAFEDALSRRSGSTLEELFLDFSICNYARDYDATALEQGDRYRYLDEQTQRILSSVPVENIAALPAFGNRRAIDSFSTRYYEHSIPESGACQAVGFKGHNADDRMAFAAVAVDGDDRVIGIRKGIGREYAATFFSSPDRPIRRICGIAVGLDEDTRFDYAFGSGELKAEIVRPTSSHPAYPGPHAEAGNLLVRLSVTGVAELGPGGPGTPSVLGLTSDSFDVYVDDIYTPNLYANYVGGEYQILVRAPDPGADGTYDLRVELCDAQQGGVSAVSRSSVYYGDVRHHHAVCIDVSGSMDHPTSAKLDAAKEAAKFYVDAVGLNDKVTVVTFSGNNSECDEDAKNLHPGGSLYEATDANREVLKAALAGLGSENMTSIGDGLWTSQDALDSATATDYYHYDTILLLSDGKENEDRYWGRTNCIASGTVEQRMVGSGTMVNSIAFGANADHGLMQVIGLTTAGDYSYVPVDEYSGSSAGMSAPLGAGVAGMFNSLALRFLQGLERTKGLERLALGTADVGAGGTGAIDLDLGELEARRGILYASWSTPGTVAATFRDPDGNDPSDYAAAVFKGTSHVVLHFEVPLSKGNYRVEFENSSGSDQACFAGISGVPSSGLAVDFTLSQKRTGGINRTAEGDQEVYEQGVPVDMRAMIYDRLGPVRDAEVEVRVIMPDGREACSRMVLLDDGRSIDDAYRDGIYGLRYGRTPLAGRPGGTDEEYPKTPEPEDETGNYRVVLTARGKANDGSVFERTIERDFQVYRRLEGFDGDGDGLPDTWEIYYGTNPYAADQKEDPDHDGLTNLEEFEYGTHPFDPDMDGGGESDGSEVKAGRCPLNRLDDDLPPLSEASIITGYMDSPGHRSGIVPNALLLHFPDHSAYRELHVHRSTNAFDVAHASNLVAVVDLSGAIVTHYYDEGLDDGVRYYYRLRAEGSSGATTPFTRILSAVAKADPFAPAGGISINGGRLLTDRIRVLLELRADASAVEYRVSQSPFTGFETWYPLVDRKEFDLFGVSNRQTAVVYAQFRGAGRLPSGRKGADYVPGNESDVVSATITLVQDGDNDGDGLSDATDPDDDNDGISDADEIFVYGTNPYEADSDGDGHSDPKEIEAGSDPNDRLSIPGDRDGDGLPDDLEDAYGSGYSTDPGQRPDLSVRIVPDAGGSNYTLRMPTGAGLLYWIQSNASPTNGGTWKDLGDPVEGTGADMDEPIPPDGATRFHRVRVIVP